MGVSIIGTSGTTKADVNTDNELTVALSKTTAKAGLVKLAARVDSGSVLGAELTREPHITPDRRLRMAQDALLLSEQFPGTALNTAIWMTNSSTMVINIAGGSLSTNSTLVTSSGAVARVTSQAFFPLHCDGSTIVSMLAQFAQPPVTNNVCEWGLFMSSGTATPTDGVFFRLTAAAEFRCVVNCGGVETQSAALDFNALVGESVTRNFAISVNRDAAEFFVAGTLVARILRPAGQMSLTISPSAPVSFRCYNAAIVSAAQALKIGAVSVVLAEVGAGVPYEIGRILGGGAGYQGQTGQTQGSTANYANSANPTAAVPTNTTAALGSGLGGQFWETDTLAVNTDGIICSYQNPAATTAIPGRVLMVTGVTISSFVQTALTGGGYNEQWVLAFGHTAVSLATTESTTAKAPRRKPLGARAVSSGAAALTQLPDIVRTFSRPIPVNPGEFLQLVKKKVGAAPTAGVIAHLIDIEGYWL